MARRKQAQTKTRSQPLVVAQMRTVGSARLQPAALGLGDDKDALAGALEGHARTGAGLPDGVETAILKVFGKQAVLDNAAVQKMARATEFEEHSPGARRLALGAVEKHDRPEPENPNRSVRGLRTIVQYHHLWVRGTLNDAQREACDRYLMECEAEQGARDRPGMESAGRAPGVRQTWPADAQIRAVVSLRAARAAVGLNGRALLDLLVLTNLSVRQIAERRKEDQKVTMGQVQATLTRLGEWWGC